MKKISLFLFMIFCISFSVNAMEAGTGISVFVPESLYTYGEGSVSLEQSLEFSLGLGEYLSIPVGFTYNTNYGLMVDGEDKADSPWFYTDSILPYAMLKAHVPLGYLFIELFGGVGANFNFTLRALEGNMEKDLSTDSEQVVFEDGTLEYDKLWGLGYLAGAGIGVTIDQISVQISCLYRNIQHQLNMSADYADVSDVQGSYDPGEDVTLLMRGISIGLGGSFAF